MRARGWGWEEARARRGVVMHAGAYDAFKACVRDEDRATIAQEWDKIMRWAHFVESTRASDENACSRARKKWPSWAGELWNGDGDAVGEK